MSIPAWKGEDISEKSILVWTDQGLGDSLIVARYLPLIRAKRVIAYVDSPLYRLFRTIPGIEVLMKPWAFPKTDYHVSLMSLMAIFHAERSIPQAQPFRVPRRTWPQLAGKPRPLVGLNWQGSKRFTGDKARSFPLELLTPIIESGVGTLVSLQKGNAQKDIGERPILDFMDECRDMYDTAALMQELDLVISSDTAVPHLSAAIGRPTWVMLQKSSTWHWGLRNTSPWYVAARLFRQEEPGDWKEVVGRVERALRYWEEEKEAA